MSHIPSISELITQLEQASDDQREIVSRLLNGKNDLIAMTHYRGEGNDEPMLIVLPQGVTSTELQMLLSHRDPDRFCFGESEEWLFSKEVTPKSVMSFNEADVDKIRAINGIEPGKWVTVSDNGRLFSGRVKFVGEPVEGYDLMTPHRIVGVETPQGVRGIRLHDVVKVADAPAPKPAQAPAAPSM